MAWNQVLGLAAAVGIGGFLAWRVGAFLVWWIKGVWGIDPPTLGQRLDAAFNGIEYQVAWKIRGGGIYPEDLVKAAESRGYEFVSGASGVSVFRRMY